MIKLQTKKQIAIDSLDHKHPFGCIRDNNSSIMYITTVKNYFNNKKINVLDLGCAGGQIIVDHTVLGDLAVGLEGSSHALTGAGKHNWDQYKDKNLFLCDITEPYTLTDNDDNILQFDYIQMWEVLEHIPENKLTVLFENIKKHLKPNGIFAGSVATYHCISGTHVSVFSKNKWESIFGNNKMTMEDYYFDFVPRPVSTGNDGFLFCAKIIP